MKPYMYMYICTVQNAESWVVIPIIVAWNYSLLMVLAPISLMGWLMGNPVCPCWLVCVKYIQGNGKPFTFGTVFLTFTFEFSPGLSFHCFSRSALYEQENWVPQETILNVTLYAVTNGLLNALLCSKDPLCISHDLLVYFARSVP